MKTLRLDSQAEENLKLLLVLAAKNPSADWNVMALARAFAIKLQETPEDPVEADGATQPASPVAPPSPDTADS